MSRFIVTETEPAPPAQGQDHERGEPQSPEELPPRKRDPSAAADASAEAEAAEEQLDGALSLEDGRAVGDYELYGVVHHLGAHAAAARHLFAGTSECNLCSCASLHPTLSWL